MSIFKLVRVLGLVILSCLGIALASPAAAQTISATDRSVSNGLLPYVGHSFKATVTGTVTQIRVVSDADTNTVLHLVSGAGTGVNNNVVAPLRSQAVALTDSRPGLAFQTITLNSPLPVTAGSVYTFVFESSSLRRGPATYADGLLYFSGNTPNFANNLAFEVVQVAAASVPTLSEWAMILFGLMLAGGAALYIQRRQLSA